MNGNTQNPTTIGEFSPDVISAVNDRLAKTGCPDYLELKVPVSVTSGVKILSSEVALLVAGRNNAITVTGSEIEEALSTEVALRCEQVVNSRPKNTDSRDVPVPDFFYPFLAAIGKYEDPTRSLHVTPVPGKPADKRTVVEEPNFVVDCEKVRHLKETMRKLRVLGVRCTNGLPKELTTQSSDLFRVEETPSGELYLAGERDVPEATLLVRACVRVLYLKDVWGASRTRYVSVEDLSGALEMVAATAI